MTFQQIFIINLKIFRKNRNVSQAKLAELCGSSQAYIAEIEVGKKFPSHNMIERIAYALDVESYRLFQDRAEDGQTLTPLQREEIICSLQNVTLKILNQY